MCVPVAFKMDLHCENDIKVNYAPSVLLILRTKNPKSKATKYPGPVSVRFCILFVECAVESFLQ